MRLTISSTIDLRCRQWTTIPHSLELAVVPLDKRTATVYKSFMETLSDTVREVIRERGLSYSEVGRLARVQPSQIGRFMRGERGLTSDSLDRICTGLELVLIPAAEAAQLIKGGRGLVHLYGQIQTQLEKVGNVLEGMRAKKGQN